MPQKQKLPKDYFGPGNEDMVGVDPVAELESAKALLGRLQQTHDDRERVVQGSQGGTSKLEQKLKADASYTKPLKRAADVGAMVSALVPNPTSPLAGLYLGARGVEDAVESPSATSAALAGLGVLPLLRPVANAVKEMRAVRALDNGVRRTYGAGDLGAAFSREVPYRAPGGVSAEPIVEVPGPTRGGHVVGHDLDYKPSPKQYTGGHVPESAQGPETMLQRARAQVAQFLSGAEEAPTGGSTRPLPGRRPATPPQQPDEIAQMFARAEASPASMRGLDRAIDIPMADVMESPAAQRFGFLRSHDVTPSETRMNELVTKFGGRGATPATGEYTAFPAKVGGRVGDLHEAQTTGGQHGFDDLPELSEDELTRLQALFKRVTGR